MTAARVGKREPPRARGKSGTSDALSLRRAAGQALIVGLEGPELSALERSWLKLIQPAGIILFRRNIESAPQTHALLQAIEQAAGWPDERVAQSSRRTGARLLRCIDAEGGTVDRLRDLLAPMPSASAVAATRDRRLFALHGRYTARALRLLGLNVNFAPVLDLDTPASAQVLGSRTASGEPAAVIEYARGFLAGMAREGVLGCGKHFPGLGGGRVDSHHLTPRIEKRFATLWEEDLLPYRRLAAELPLVMISHARYPLTPSGDEPASISHFWMSEVLGRKIGFRGLIVSDDMEMGGILAHASLPDAARTAIEAGAHLIEICRDPALVFAAYEALLAEAEASPGFARKLRRAAGRVAEFKRMRFGGDRLPRALTPSALRSMRSQMERFSKQIQGLGESAGGKRRKGRVR